MEYRKPNKGDWARTAIYVAVYTAAIGVGAFLLIPRGAPGALAGAILVILGAFLLIRWHAKNTAYRCAKCNHGFEISIFTDAISHHGARGEAGNTSNAPAAECGPGPRCCARNEAPIPSEIAAPPAPGYR